LFVLFLYNLIIMIMIVSLWFVGHRAQIWWASQSMFQHPSLWQEFSPLQLHNWGKAWQFWYLDFKTLFCWSKAIVWSQVLSLFPVGTKWMRYCFLS
jgi:hypothetical protein